MTLIKNKKKSHEMESFVPLESVRECLSTESTETGTHAENTDMLKSTKGPSQFEPHTLSQSIIIHLQPSLKTVPETFDESLNCLTYTPEIITPSAYDHHDNLFCPLKSDTVETSNLRKLREVGELGEIGELRELRECGENNGSYPETSDMKHMKHYKESSQDARDSLFTAESIWCWWCCHPYQTKSVQLPVRIKPNGTYECVGEFCSPNCIASYIVESGSKYGDSWEQLELLHSMTNAPSRINPAPHREELIVFGGTKSIEEFRAKNHKMQTIVHQPPMVSLKLHMDDIPQEQNVYAKPSDTFLNLDTIELHDVVETKKRKSSKKSKADANTLDKFMGCNS